MARLRHAPRYPPNDISSLLDVHRPHNLAESTSRDLTLGELCSDEDWQRLRSLGLGYGSSLGSPELRERLGRALECSPQSVLITSGAAFGLHALASELCRGPDDHVVIVRPCFPPSLESVRATGATVREVRCRFEDGYALDLDALRASLTEDVRLVSLASPQNPSGVIVPDAAIEAVLTALEERAPEAFLLIDETYRESTYDGNIPPSRASSHPRLVTTASLSKAYGCPGIRTGWLTTLDSELLARLTRVKMNCVISHSVVDEALACLALDKRETLLGARVRGLSLALDQLDAWHRTQRERLDCVRPSAGGLCCFRLRPNVFDDAAVVRFFDSFADFELQLAHGEWFGDERRVFRLGFGYPPLETLDGALAAVGRAMDRCLG